MQEPFPVVLLIESARKYNPLQDIQFSGVFIHC